VDDRRLNLLMSCAPALTPKQYTRMPARAIYFIVWRMLRIGHLEDARRMTRSYLSRIATRAQPEGIARSAGHHSPTHPLGLDANTARWTSTMTSDGLWRRSSRCTRTFVLTLGLYFYCYGAFGEQRIQVHCKTGRKCFLSQVGIPRGVAACPETDNHFRCETK
jgi:hypothetical protein